MRKLLVVCIIAIASIFFSANTANAAPASCSVSPNPTYVLLETTLSATDLPVNVPVVLETVETYNGKQISYTPEDIVPNSDGTYSKTFVPNLNEKITFTFENKNTETDITFCSVRVK